NATTAAKRPGSAGARSVGGVGGHIGAPHLERHFGAFVLHSSGLVVPAWQRAGIADLDTDADAQAELQIFRERFAQPAALVERQRWRGIQAHQDVVETVAAAEDDLELVHVAVRPYQLLDPPRVDDDA